MPPYPFAQDRKQGARHINGAVKWAFRHIPLLQRAFRWSLFWFVSLGIGVADFHANNILSSSSLSI